MQHKVFFKSREIRYLKTCLNPSKWPNIGPKWPMRGSLANTMPSTFASFAGKKYTNRQDLVYFLFAFMFISDTLTSHRMVYAFGQEVHKRVYTFRTCKPVDRNTVLVKIISGLPGKMSDRFSMSDILIPMSDIFSRLIISKYWILLDKMSGKVRGLCWTSAEHVWHGRHILRGLVGTMTENGHHYQIWFYFDSVDQSLKRSCQVTLILII